MKNKKGEIATLLTLGLVVVGTLITLGTSLFVSSNKTNLASNSRAGGCSAGTSVGGGYYSCAAGCGATTSGNCPSYTHNSKDSSCTSCNSASVQQPASGEVPASTTGCKYHACSIDNPAYTNGGYYLKTGASGPWKEGCTVKITVGEGNYCKSLNPNPQAPAAEEPAVTDNTQCPNTYTNSGAANVTCGGAQNAYPLLYTQVGCTNGTFKCLSANPGTSTTVQTNQITQNTAVGEGQNCCFQKKGKVYVYASYQSMVNNQMVVNNVPDCKRLTASVVNSYTADNPPGAFVCAGGTANMTSVEDYNAANPANGASADQGADDLVVPEGCKSTDCKSYFTTEPNFSSDVLISTSEVAPLSYFKSGDCAASSKVGGVNDLHKYCKDKSSAEASVTCVPDLSCKENYGGNGNKYSYSIDAAGTTTYYKGKSCFGTPKATGEADVKAYCTDDPAAEANATCKKDVPCSETGSANTKTKISSKTFSNKTVYYENNDCSGTAASEETVKAYCDNNAPPVNPFENVIKNEAEVNNYICSLIPQEKYTGAAVLSPFVKKCEDAAKNINAPIFKVIISDYDVEGWVTADYMNCCIK